MTQDVIANPWRELRTFTRARIALGRAGDSLPTDAVLEFGLAHARARDAVHEPLDVAALDAALSAVGLRSLAVKSEARDRAQYLLRPDLGRRLDAASGTTLDTYRRHAAEAAVASGGGGVAAPSIVFVIADGLSAFAPQRHALPLLGEVLPQLRDWHVGPIVIATQSRVALGDGIGERLGADVVVMLIGERPGLSSPDSLGLYLTWAPRVGRTDAERNCISNVRPEGLDYPSAARKLAFLLGRARALGATGLALKDESASNPTIGG
ncbi:ethanolamine ammonia-lyase subunit EutC [Pararobbsia silviterrae]|uniref:Ethanolamine ammonia-lyase small subunit n=1 Tax=Pararobbsia silviterrae TaxID=1792498 RepID=A0A494X7F0_9BURK|nr:ethanolamine ammonia-lyase subunit EutC [Pararobbsia silviterrae]RKP44226.1 ethanolamine ammonia-lyase subunit EutC [Pararobbsia silviterrae]